MKTWLPLSGSPLATVLTTCCTAMANKVGGLVSNAQTHTNILSHYQICYVFDFQQLMQKTELLIANSFLTYITRPFTFVLYTVSSIVAKLYFYFPSIQ